MVQHLVADPLVDQWVALKCRLLVADQEVDRPVGEHLRLPGVVDDRVGVLVAEVETFPVDFDLHGVHLGVDRTPRPDGCLRPVRQRQRGLDDGPHPHAGVRLLPDHLSQFQCAVLLPVRDQLAGVGVPAGEIVIEGAGRHAESAAHLGQFQLAQAEVGEDLQAGLEIGRPGGDDGHGQTLRLPAPNAASCREAHLCARVSRSCDDYRDDHRPNY